MSSAQLPAILEFGPSVPSPKKKVILRYRPLREWEIPGFAFDNATGAATIDNRTFGLNEAIKDLNVRNCFVVNRPIDFVQKLTLYVDGEWQEFSLDHRSACGWRCIGYEPILEVESLVDFEKHLFVYTYHSEGQWVWCHVTPTTEDVPGVFTMHQLPRFKYLIAIALTVSGYYAGASAAAAFAIWKLWSL